jgi:hypothetical protein
MKRSVAAVLDQDDKLFVKYVCSYQTSILKNDDLYVGITEVAGKIIQQAISEHKMVYLPKGVEGELSLRDVVISETDGVYKDKMVALSTLYRKVDYNLYNIGAIDFYDHMCAFNELSARGYFITDNNREEKYIEIISAGDEKLIDILEVYLEKKDKLDVFSYVWNRTKKYEKKIHECETQEEVSELIEEFNNE